VDDPLPLYREADILMMTSRYEGIPVLIYEAMVAGIPIVTSTRDTAIEEVLTPDEASFIAKPTDPIAYVQALEAILDNPAAANCRAERVAARSARLSRERYARDLLDLLG
jgi:glycosyltransferase involved in cell wall biosynthesis